MKETRLGFFEWEDHVSFINSSQGFELSFKSANGKVRFMFDKKIIHFIKHAWFPEANWSEFQVEVVKFVQTED